MMKNSDDEKPELQWVEDLILGFMRLAGELATGIVLAVVACGKWLGSLIYDDKPRPPSPE